MLRRLRGFFKKHDQQAQAPAPLLAPSSSSSPSSSETKISKEEKPTRQDQMARLPAVVFQNILVPMLNMDEIQNLSYASKAQLVLFSDPPPHLQERMKAHRRMIGRQADKIFTHLARGEQAEVQAMLNEALKLGSQALIKLLKMQHIVIDHAERRFVNITLFQLALWYLDRHMWQMLLTYFKDPSVREVLRGEAHRQYQKHKSGQTQYATEHGQYYQFEGKEPGREGLVTELQACNDLLVAPGFSWRDKAQATRARKKWQSGVGGAQARSPLHVIQEYCREDGPNFAGSLPETRFKEEHLPRTVDFQNTITDNEMTFWEGLTSGLGSTFGICRPRAGASASCSPVGGMGLPLRDEALAAVSRLCQVRKEEYGLLEKALIPEPDSSPIEKEKKNAEKPDTCLLPMSIPFAQDEADEKFRPALRMISHTTSAPGALFFSEQKTLPVFLRSQDGAHRVTSSHNRSVLSIDEKPTTPAFFQLPVSAQITKNKVEEIGDKFTEAWTKLQPYLPNKQQFRELEQLVSQVRLNSSIKNEELIQHIQVLQKKMKDIAAIEGGGFTSGISSMALMADGSPTKSYISGLVVDLYANILTLEELLLKQPKIKMSVSSATTLNYRGS